MDKSVLSERDICTKFITPALRKAGWDEMLQIREEVSFTNGRHRQDLHRVSDHLAPVEGGPQEAHPVPRRPQRANRPDDDERLPPVWRGDGEAFGQRQDH
jgi:hypothetical protein